MADAPRSSLRLEDRRPLSPHLLIYRPMLTMMMSIAHRITGAALYVGTLMVTWWLLAAATGPQAFATVNAVMGSVLGLLVMFGFTWALFHHFFGGLRHAIWDTGRGMEPAERELLAMGTLVCGFVAAVLVFIAAFVLR